MMRVRRVAVALGVVLAGALMPRSVAAQAGSPTDATTHFRLGVGLYKDGDYSSALVEFRRAYQLTPNFRVLYNLAQAYYQLQRYADAYQAFQRYLTDGGEQIPPARRTAVEADLRQLATHVGDLQIAVSEDGAEVRVDDEVVGTSPLDSPVLVSVGHRRITVAKAGRNPVTRAVDVASGDHARLTFELPSEPPPPPAVVATPAPAPALLATPPRAESSRSEHPSLLWIPWTVAGAFATATAITGIVTLGEKARLERMLESYPADPAAIASSESRGKTFAVTTDILLASTVVATGVATYFTLTTTKGAPTDSSLRVGISPSGMSLSKRF